jgi:hypothetical protein
MDGMEEALSDAFIVWLGVYKLGIENNAESMQICFVVLF